MHLSGNIRPIELSKQEDIGNTSIGIFGLDGRI